jgi:hypothetical protein
MGWVVFPLSHLHFIVSKLLSASISKRTVPYTPEPDKAASKERKC